MPAGSPARLKRGSFLRNLVTWDQQRALRYQVTAVQMQDSFYQALKVSHVEEKNQILEVTSTY